MNYLTQARNLFSAVAFALLAVFGVTSSFAMDVQTSSAMTHEQVAVVNINTASAAELATVLSGIGGKKAEEIVAFRVANGQFAAAVELTEVKGVGEATFEKNRHRIVVE